METKSLISLIFFLHALTSCVNLLVAQKNTLGNQQAATCSKGKFQSDLKELDKAFGLLASFNAYSADSGYGTGNGSKVYTSLLCSAKIKKEVCQGCVNNTISYLRKQCPNQNEGLAWTALNNDPLKAHCMVRYADYNFVTKLVTWGSAAFSSQDNDSPTNAADLEKGFNNLVEKLKSAYTGDPNKIGSGFVTYGPGSHKLYGFMQCTPPTSKENCAKCFSDATKNILDCCLRKRKSWGTALHSNCYIRYSHVNFIPTNLWT